MLPCTPYIMSSMHLLSLKLLHPTVQGEMHLQENILCDLDLGVAQNVAVYPPHHMTNAKIEVATSNGLGDAFTRKYNI